MPTLKHMMRAKQFPVKQEKEQERYFQKGPQVTSASPNYKLGTVSGHRLEEVHQAKAQLVLTSSPGLAITTTTDHCKMLMETEGFSQENVNCIYKDMNFCSWGIFL